MGKLCLEECGCIKINHYKVVIHLFSPDDHIREYELCALEHVLSAHMFFVT